MLDENVNIKAVKEYLTSAEKLGLSKSAILKSLVEQYPAWVYDCVSSSVYKRTFVKTATSTEEKSLGDILQEFKSNPEQQGTKLYYVLVNPHGPYRLIDAVKTVRTYARTHNFQALEGLYDAKQVVTGHYPFYATNKQAQELHELVRPLGFFVKAA